MNQDQKTTGLNGSENAADQPSVKRELTSVYCKPELKCLGVLNDCADSLGAYMKGESSGFGLL